MNVNQLREILRQDEGLKLDFKQEYKLSRNPSSDTDRQEWKQLTNGQWDELIKDIIALANGNVGVSDKVGLLVIGADDQLQPDGTRNIFDVSHLQLSTQQIIAKVNNVCEPPIPDISCEELVFNGQLLYIVSIPPTPYVHETNRPLTTLKGNFDGTGKLISLGTPKVYTEYTAFIRKGENISPASANERRALEYDKKFDLIIMNENLKFDLVGNLKVLLSKSKDRLYDPTIYYQAFKDIYTIKVDADLFIKGEHLNWVALAVFGVGPSKSNLSTRFIEQAINSGRYLSYNSQEGRYERSKFLDYLHELRKNIDKLLDIADHPIVAGFIGKYHPKGRRDETIRVNNFDIVFVAAMLERYENVVQLSSALLAYLLGDRTRLENLRLNRSSPIETQNQGIEAETPTDDEVIEWVLKVR